MVRDTKLYDTLGVAPTATKEEIVKAHRMLAREWHPDKNIDRKELAEAKFKEIQHAKDILTDEKKRRIYDQVGEKGLQMQPDDAAGEHFPGAGSGFPGGATFVFRSNGGNAQQVPPEMLEQLFGGLGGGMFGGMPFGNGGEFSFGNFGGPGYPGAKRSRTSAQQAAGPFVPGAQVRAVGLTGVKELNGKIGCITGVKGDRIVVDFGSTEKALKASNLRACSPDAFVEGAAVTAEGLTGAAHLNGKRGRVQGCAPCGTRVQVDFGGSLGVKALQLDNVCPQ